MPEEPRAPTPRPVAIALGVMIVAFATLYTTLASWKAAGLVPEWGFDLTFFHNLVWNLSEGNGYRQSASYHEPPGVFNESHFEPIIILATPIYKFLPRVETLFAIQSSLIALGALGIFRIVRSAGAAHWGALGGALIYLMWWPVWRMTMADIRPLLWCVPFLILLVACLREGRRAEAFVWGGLACLCREEIPILVGAVCLLALFWRHGDTGKRRKTALFLGGGVLAFMGTTWLLRSNPSFYIRPGYWLKTLLGAEDVDAAMSGYGHDAGELLRARITYLGEWLLPAGLGALLAPEILLASGPLFLYLFTRQDEWATWEGPYIHWAVPALALTAAAAAVGWTRLLAHPRLPRHLPALILGFVLLGEAAVLFGHPGLVGGEGARSLGWDRSDSRWERYIAEEIRPWREQQPHVLEAHRLADLVPPDAAVMADDGRGERGEIQAAPIHLLSGRSHLYSYQQEEISPVEPGGDTLEGPLLPPAAQDPDWALIHVADESWIRRALAAGLHERERGEHWVLLGPEH